MALQRPTNLPDDVLLIHYPALATNVTPAVRLHVLAAIGRLLNQGVVNCSIRNLSQKEEILLHLELWLQAEEASKFWQFKDERVVSVKLCEKHVLVGTQQLLQDLSSWMAYPDRSLREIDSLWQAATIFVKQRVELE
jgi:hypothetical protein